MTTERPTPQPGPGPGDTPARPLDAHVDEQARERADLAEDKRCQEELDYGELGGEA